jgi:hypothetical protein
LFVLHGSCIALSCDDGSHVAIALVGEKGQGKSTLAAAFLKQGHLVLTDDIVAIDLTRDVPHVLPGFSQLKLWPESVRHLDEGIDHLPRIRPQLEKRLRATAQQMPKHAIPLGSVLAIHDAPSNAIEPLSPQEQLMTVVRNTYVVSILRETGQSPAHLRESIGLAQRVRVARLNRIRALDALPEIVHLIEHEFAPKTIHAAQRA